MFMQICHIWLKINMGCTELGLGMRSDARSCLRDILAALGGDKKWVDSLSSSETWEQARRIFLSGPTLWGTPRLWQEDAEPKSTSAGKVSEEIQLAEWPTGPIPHALRPAEVNEHGTLNTVERPHYMVMRPQSRELACLRPGGSVSGEGLVHSKSPSSTL
jgi:hypothetical protein